MSRGSFSILAGMRFLQNSSPGGEWYSADTIQSPGLPFMPIRRARGLLVVNLHTEPDRPAELVTLFFVA